ncbi:MAG: hypothetical protein IKJ15_01850 [Lachnospiraceae bacterium]|nr:hypothetical protein [Lachnospiraceae bacterium]
MRKYSKSMQLTEAFCNCCKKQLKIKNGIITEGVFSVGYAFGYFSNKDEEIHKFDLCEKCYDEWTKTFQIPVEIADNTELL